MILCYDCNSVTPRNNATSLQARVRIGQSLCDTFMFRPSPPAAFRSLKVTFVAFLVSDAQRYKVMLLVEAAHLRLSGLVHVYTSCGCCLHSHTSPVFNWILCAWIKKCLLKSNKTKKTKKTLFVLSGNHINKIAVKSSKRPHATRSFSPRAPLRWCGDHFYWVAKLSGSTDS